MIPHSDSSDSEDGNGGDDGINDSSTTSNSIFSSSKPTSSDVIFTTECPTFILFSRTRQVAEIEFSKILTKYKRVQH